MPLPLEDVLPDEDYRFHLTLRPTDAAEFFRSPNVAALAERSRWLETDADRYAALTPEGEPLLDEFESALTTWQRTEVPRGDPLHRLLHLGRTLEADFLLLEGNEAAGFHLQAGVVCFPTMWALGEKIGRSLDEIHGPVPTLNGSLGPSIGRFLARIRPGTAYEWANWGLAATPELNLHPHLKRPSLSRAPDLKQIWLRIEDQLLTRLPSTLGILFGIRLRILPFSEILAEENLRGRFRRAIATMPEPVAVYKGIAPIRHALLELTDADLA